MLFHLQMIHQNSIVSVVCRCPRGSRSRSSTVNASESEAVRKALKAFGMSGIEYMIVGTHAASIHGFTRAAHDLDIVVSLHSEDVGGLGFPVYQRAFCFANLSYLKVR